MDLPDLIRALRNPEAYPDHPPSVKVIETHISAVFLTGKFAYKIKKPVNFGYLDFSTLEKRRFFCEREVDLNRRLCPEIYLGVVGIHCQEGRVTVGSGPSLAVLRTFDIHGTSVPREPPRRQVGEPTDANGSSWCLPPRVADVLRRTQRGEECDDPGLTPPRPASTAGR